MATQAVARTVYDPAVADEILRRMMNGETVTAAAASIGVDRGAIYVWKRDRPDLDAAFEAARLAGAEMIAQDALRIVDGDDLDDLVPMDLEGVRGLVNRKTQLAAAGGDPVARARLRFEGRMKLLSKWFPAHYGDKLLHAGHDGGAIKSETALSVKELAAQLRARASGITIDGDAKEVLTDASTRFNATSVSNEGQTDDQTNQRLPQATQPGEPQEAASVHGQARNGGVHAATRGDDVPRRARFPLTEASGAGLRAGVQSAAAGADGSVPGARRQKARSRGVGGPGGAPKRGASAQTSGTPPTDIFSTNSSTSESTCFPDDANWSPEDYV